jgi:hypothetical protein
MEICDRVRGKVRRPSHIRVPVTLNTITVSDWSDFVINMYMAQAHYHLVVGLYT